METFELGTHDYIELNNLLKITGFCESGGMAKSLIAEGQVMVDSQIETRKRCKIRAGQIVELAGQRIQITL